MYEEILSKEDRPYSCLLVKQHGYLICVPFRTEIRHKYAYHYQVSEDRESIIRDWILQKW